MRAYDGGVGVCKTLQFVLRIVLLWPSVKAVVVNLERCQPGLSARLHLRANSAFQLLHVTHAYPADAPPTLTAALEGRELFALRRAYTAHFSLFWPAGETVLAVLERHRLATFGFNNSRGEELDYQSLGNPVQLSFYDGALWGIRNAADGVIAQLNAAQTSATCVAYWCQFEKRDEALRVELATHCAKSIYSCVWYRGQLYAFPGYDVVSMNDELVVVVPSYTALHVGIGADFAVYDRQTLDCLQRFDAQHERDADGRLWLTRLRVPLLERPERLARPLALAALVALLAGLLLLPSLLLALAHVLWVRCVRRRWPQLAPSRRARSMSSAVSRRASAESAAAKPTATPAQPDGIREIGTVTTRETVPAAEEKLIPWLTKKLVQVSAEPAFAFRVSTLTKKFRDQASADNKDARCICESHARTFTSLKSADYFYDKYFYKGANKECSIYPCAVLARPDFINMRYYAVADLYDEASKRNIGLDHFLRFLHHEKIDLVVGSNRSWITEGKEGFTRDGQSFSLLLTDCVTNAHGVVEEVYALQVDDGQVSVESERSGRQRRTSGRRDGRKRRDPDEQDVEMEESKPDKRRARASSARKKSSVNRTTAPSALSKDKKKTEGEQTDPDTSKDETTAPRKAPQKGEARPSKLRKYGPFVAEPADRQAFEEKRQRLAEFHGYDPLAAAAPALPPADKPRTEYSERTTDHESGNTKLRAKPLPEESTQRSDDNNPATKRARLGLSYNRTSPSLQSGASTRKRGGKEPELTDKERPRSTSGAPPDELPKFPFVELEGACAARGHQHEKLRVRPDASRFEHAFRFVPLSPRLPEQLLAAAVSTRHRRAVFVGAHRDITLALAVTAHKGIQGHLNLDECLELCALYVPNFLLTNGKDMSDNFAKLIQDLAKKK